MLLKLTSQTWNKIFRLPKQRYFYGIRMTAKNLSMCIRLGAIEGHNGKENQVLLCGNPTIKNDSHVIFFGGDVQDYKENMEKYLPHKDYVKWNLEATAEILHSKFPQSLVWVVRPNDLLHNTFSIFSSFLASIFNGAPDQSVEQQGQGSWNHLSELWYNSINNGIIHMKKSQEDTFKSDRNCDTESSPAQYSQDDIKEYEPKLGVQCVESNKADASVYKADDIDIKTLCSLPIHIIGFSKGCVVLNQLLYDLNQALDDEKTHLFVQQVKTMTWLDGGHSGGLNTWVTKQSVIEKLKVTNIEVNVHVTPYQVRDPMRNWIGKEQRNFVFILRKLGIPVHSSMHFEELEASLENHFNVLNEFK